MPKTLIRAIFYLASTVARTQICRRISDNHNGKSVTRIIRSHQVLELKVRDASYVRCKYLKRQVKRVQRASDGVEIGGRMNKNLDQSFSKTAGNS
jgi:hypothetical protein